MCPRAGCACLQSPVRTPSDLAVLCQVALPETLPTVIPQGQCVGSLSWLDWVSARLSKLSLIFFWGVGSGACRT